jgi:hypothetical protein
MSTRQRGLALTACAKVDLILAPSISHRKLENGLIGVFASRIVLPYPFRASDQRLVSYFDSTMVRSHQSSKNKLEELCC